MKKYIIKKGKHFSKGFHFGVNWMNDSVTWDFILYGNCWYNKSELNSTTGVNKLCGFGFGLNHHKNSVRIGWQPNFNNPGEIVLYFYAYNDGIRTSTIIESIKVDTENTITIKVIGDTIQIVLNGNPYTFDYYMQPKLGLYLFPYFGGDSVCPYDMNIYLRRW